MKSQLESTAMSERFERLLENVLRLLQRTRARESDWRTPDYNQGFVMRAPSLSHSRRRVPAGYASGDPVEQYPERFELDLRHLPDRAQAHGVTIRWRRRCLLQHGCCFPERICSFRAISQSALAQSRPRLQSHALALANSLNVTCP